MPPISNSTDTAISDAPVAIRLSDYERPSWSCQTVELLFDLFDDHALVTATSAWKRQGPGQELVLNGCELQTESILLDTEEVALDGPHVSAERTNIQSCSKQG